MEIKTKKDINPISVLKELEKYWCNKQYPLDGLIAGLPLKKFGSQFTVGDMIRLAIKNYKNKEEIK